MPEPDAQVFHISCHCQTHVLRLTLPADYEFADNGVCDCSHCLKRRIVWQGAPKGSVDIVRGLGQNGASELKEYRFGTKGAGYEFCGRCGTMVPGVTALQADEIMFNMRPIRELDFDLWKLPLTLYPGVNRPPPYVHTTLDNLPGAADYLTARAATYDYPTETLVGACHCQAIKFAVVTKPLADVRVNDCACSICLGNGVLWTYPGRRNVFFHPSASTDTPYTPPDSLITKYTFNSGMNAHFFCKTCGCEVYEYAERPVEDPRPPHVAAKSPWEPENGWNGSFGLNIALLSGIAEYSRDVHGLPDDGKGGQRLKGLQKEVEDKLQEPVYRLRL